MMVGVVASNGEKMPPVWFPTGQRLTAADYKEILEFKVLPWVQKILKRLSTSSNKMEHQLTPQK